MYHCIHTRSLCERMPNGDVTSHSFIDEIHWNDYTSAIGNGYFLHSDKFNWLIAMCNLPVLTEIVRAFEMFAAHFAWEGNFGAFVSTLMDHQIVWFCESSLAIFAHIFAFWAHFTTKVIALNFQYGKHFWNYGCFFSPSSEFVAFNGFPSCYASLFWRIFVRDLCLFTYPNVLVIAILPQILRQNEDLN